MNNLCQEKARRMRRHEDCLPGSNQEHSAATGVGTLASFLREEDINTTISDGDPRDRGDYIAASTENAVNREKKEEHTINEDLKLVDTFVNKVRSGLKEVGGTCKPLEDEALRVPENLPDERKIQCDISFAWEKRLWLQADIAGCHGGWYHSFLASCFYWARVGILRKFGYETEISISGAFPTANKVLEWRSRLIENIVARLEQVPPPNKIESNFDPAVFVSKAIGIE